MSVRETYFSYLPLKAQCVLVFQIDSVYSGMTVDCTEQMDFHVFAAVNRRIYDVQLIH